MYLAVKIILFLALLVVGFFMVNKYVSTNQTNMQTEFALKQLDSKDAATQNREMQEVASGNWAYPIIGFIAAVLFLVFFYGDIKGFCFNSNSDNKSQNCCK